MRVALDSGAAGSPGHLKAPPRGCAGSEAAARVSRLQGSAVPGSEGPPPLPPSRAGAEQRPFFPTYTYFC